MISFWGGGDPEHRKLGSFIDHEERLETCLALIGCSPSAQMTPWDRQGTRNGKIPQHMRRLLVYQLEHQISAPSCNGDCKDGSSQGPKWDPAQGEFPGPDTISGAVKHSQKEIGRAHV